jgi:hypothetical protein
MMHEQIVAAILRRDESESLVRVEPLHCTLCHVFFSLDPLRAYRLVPLVLYKG